MTFKPIAIARPVGSCTGPVLLDIIFVHGLGGDNTSTWDADGKSFWPDWLLEDIAQCRVVMAGFDSNMFARILSGEGTSIQDLATILADDLSSRELRAPNRLFVAHSLGGLVVKQMLRRCHESGDPDYNDLANGTLGIAFLGTPHVGAHLTTALDALLRRFKSKQTKQLAYAEDGLIDLNEFFRTWAANQHVAVKSYYETLDTGGIRIVDKVTANPNVHGSDPVAVEANHIQICKPQTRSARVYTSVAALIRKVLRRVEAGGSNALVPFDPSKTLLPLSHMPLIQAPSTGPFGASVIESWKSKDATLPANAPGDKPIDVGDRPVEGDLLADYQFYTTVSEDDRRDLAAKLHASGREYATRDAERKKERFSMALRRHIAQPAAVRRYTRLMADVETRFKRHVGRVIANGADTAAVDHAIQDNVITPCTAMHSSLDNEISAALVESSLYYLAGNCHLAWDNG